ncbi:MAG: hypothetical protein CVU39_10990 [Chloroflexi bacterium HGW-Chloroflexi-10]|nr:MAG: hypothetical protein CVU39_10990 [Chloroflexi bacterium HGW-Chloroflexi-10]
MEESQLPDRNRLSILSAVILLSYALIPFVKLPGQQVSLQMAGFFFQIQIDFGTIISIFTAILAGLGTDWLLESHPHRQKQTLIRHGFVPMLTAWAIGVPLTTLEVTPEWWVVLALGGTLLVLVLIAEYIVVDSGGSMHLPASLGLTAISFALFLILAITSRAAGLRLFLLVPALSVALFLLVLRSLYLRSVGRWNWVWALGITGFISQLAVSFHYLPFQPLSFGLALVAVAYPLTSLAAGLEEGRQASSLWVEPILLFVILMSLSLVVGG